MPNNQQALLVTQPEPVKKYKFPFLHFIAGLVLSFICFGVLVTVWGGIVLRSEASFNGLNILPGVLQAFLFPEIITISTLLWLAIRKHNSGERGYMSSYITMIVINIALFCFICAVMWSIQC